jgi:hypothetical protein
MLQNVPAHKMLSCMTMYILPEEHPWVPPLPLFEEAIVLEINSLLSLPAEPINLGCFGFAVTKM